MDAIATMIIALCTALIAGMGTASVVAKKMTSKEECKETREHCSLVRHERFVASNFRIDAIQKSIECLKKSNDIQYAMLRSIVIHMPGISDEEKTNILNFGKDVKK